MGARLAMGHLLTLQPKQNFNHPVGDGFRGLMREKEKKNKAVEVGKGCGGKRDGKFPNKNKRKQIYDWLTFFFFRGRNRIVGSSYSYKKY